MKSVSHEKRGDTDRSNGLSTCCVATSRTWHEGIVENLSKSLKQPIELINSKDQLTVEKLDLINPRYIFFPHWSYIIPEKIFSRYECVIFHMTDLPFGRGGSPLQNLISRGYTETKITALKCVKELDAGPVYMKRPLSLHGSAEEIFLRVALIIEKMIEEIISTEPEPKAQTGAAITFKRRKPEQSELTEMKSLSDVYDQIRMLDATGYPKAFIVHDGYRYEFTRGSLKQDHLLADVKITKVENE